MKKIVFVLSFLIFGAFLSGKAYAGWHFNIPIDTVNMHAEGAVSFVAMKTTGTMPNPAGCQSFEYVSIADGLGIHNENRALAILLTAKATGRTVNLFIDPNACGPYGRPRATAIQMHD
jgi:hypothetical protein